MWFNVHEALDIWSDVNYFLRGLNTLNPKLEDQCDPCCPCPAESKAE